jgi:hypothetical protein
MYTPYGLDRDRDRARDCDQMLANKVAAKRKWKEETVAGYSSVNIGDVRSSNAGRRLLETHFEDRVWTFVGCVHELGLKGCRHIESTLRRSVIQLYSWYHGLLPGIQGSE